MASAFRKRIRARVETERLFVSVRAQVERLDAEVCLAQRALKPGARRTSQEYMSRVISARSSARRKTPAPHRAALRAMVPWGGDADEVELLMG